ncbi:spectrin beta chain, non-erythrocytic 5 kst [Tachypleus tridentatus]|uniref:spectrin beta chain, non-erythrocytic 5 kst n=1 Tax=Tachypleus tridentatus TaxID=6853 RepID=UPI003FD2B1FB
MSQREDALRFETGRIKALQEERLYIQKKTFTKWMNSFLQKARMEVEDLFTDLTDGKKLLKLLEIISGEKLGKPNHGKMRVHKIENVNKSLAFLHTKVRLESIGAEDIVDGNPRLILGLIWTIILRFQIQEIEIDVNEDDESSEKKSAKDALLLWCQRKTAGYPHVNIQDFTSSWRSGLGFNALIHAHRPDLINFRALQPHDHIDNLNNAFDIAQRELGIPRLLDAEDVDINRPDEKSVITYVASYYHTFARMKTEMKGGRRIANIVGQMMDADKQKNIYEEFTSSLLDWIQQKIIELDDRKFPNSLEGIQRELLRFKEYRTVEKPPKYRERSEIEALLFAIQTKMKALGQPLYVPPEGKLVHDIEKAWEKLEKAEHQREVALREELLRQKRLENLAYRFEKKSVLREGYLKEMIQVLSDPRYGSNLAQVEATVKKHEAISADIMAREERFANLTVMADELVAENFHGKDKIKKRETEILQRWHYLLELLKKHRISLTGFSNLMSILREIDTITDEIKEMEGSIYSDDLGRHLLSVEDLLQKLSLMEAQITSQGDTIRKLNKQAQLFIKEGYKEAPVLQKRLDKLNGEYDNLVQLVHNRRAKLEESRAYYQFVQDHEEEEAWVVERQRICKTVIPGKDLLGVTSLQQKHKGLEAEIKSHWARTQKVIKAGERLVQTNHPQSRDVRQRIQTLKNKWDHLHELTALRRKQLEDASSAYQYYADVNEAESWMREKMSLVSSEDFGEDEPSARALLQRHSRLESEIKAYEADIQRLNDQSDKMIKSGIATLSVLDNGPEEPEKEKWVEEVIMVPTEEWVDEIVEQEVLRDTVEERRIPQVRALYAFRGQGMEMQKGEVMLLLQKTNSDWWHARRGNGQDGFVPANYVKEIEPKIIKKVVKQPVKVPQKERVKKRVMKRQVVKKKKQSPNNKKPLSRSSSRKDGMKVEERQKAINKTFDDLVHLAKARRSFLEDALKLFGFYRDCDDFENWMKDKERMLTTDDANDSVDVMKKQFEHFLTDLSATSLRVEDVDQMVNEFVHTKHSQIGAIKTRQRQIHDRWNRLNKLKTEKERSLEGATSVELFNRTCDEARDWMLEKLEKMDTDEMGRDMKTVQALQRRHQNLERELAPVEEKFNRVNLLADSVKASYPCERSNVTLRQKEMQSIWDRVKAKAAERKARLDESMGRQIFNNSAMSLLSWVSSVKQSLNSDEPARDVTTAENLLKDHEDLGNEIRTHEDEFNDVQELGKMLLRKNPEASDIRNMVVQLKEEHDAIHRGWQEKYDWLRQCMDLQVFNREADQIDSITNSHNAFLEFEDLGTTLDDVEALLKRHENFMNTLSAQDERLKNFVVMAEKLIAAGHYESKYIDERQCQVVALREAVKEKAEKRKDMLETSLVYQKFRAEGDELMAWVQEKMKTAGDECYRDLTNLERKLQKHEAFEAEVKANEPRVDIINKTGTELISDGNFASDKVIELLERLNTQWDDLCSQTKDKGHKLRQAVSQHSYNRTLESARSKLDELEGSLASNDRGHDLRSVKELLKKHQVLETELGVWENKVQEVINLGQEMARQGHFDAPNILKAAKAVSERSSSLEAPAAERRHQLEESLKFHQFNFDVDAEMQWIRDHLPAASSEDVGQNLIDAQNLYKKHLKLEREIHGHQPIIDKLLACGEALADQKHFAASSILIKCEELHQNWQELLSLAVERKKKLELSLRAQQFYSEANEVETWITEKNDILTRTDYGRDEDGAVRLLTKHKALELEIDTYTGLVSEMARQAQKMVDSNHPESKVINGRIQMIQKEMKKLQKLATVRRQKLVESKNRHEYFRESEELENWINEEMQMATSEEYGQDYEHLLLLQSKFDDFRHRIEAGSERYNQCEELCRKLTAVESPYTGELIQRQEHLRNAWDQLWDHIEARDQKLQAAGEIHRFNRDVAEALSRIQEKYASVPDDLGRDLNSVQSLRKKHEGFENDLVALEAQLQVLVDDSVRLQETYPGGNAEHIAEQQNYVVESWNSLQERAQLRKEQIENAILFHRFLALVRDLETWAQSLCSSINTEEKVRDATAAQLLKTEHEHLKAEIEAREENFRNVVQNGEMMIQKEHYASSEIRERLNQLLKMREQLHTGWQRKHVYLDQLLDLHCFLRDAKQLDTLSGQQEVYLCGSDFGTTVEEVDAQVKKHEAFEKLMVTQDEKLSSLQEHGVKLLQQNHFESEMIRHRIDEVTQRRNKIKNLSVTRKQKLTDALLHAKFKRDSAEAETWIEEKMKNLEAEASKGDVASIEDKIKKLQKHQAFRAELAAHDENIKAIKQKGELLLSKKHESSPEIRIQLEQLLMKWSQLLNASANRGRGLEEAQDMFELNNQMEKVEAWIRDKEMMVQAGDTGKDYEHCLALQRKLNDVDSDMLVDDSRIKSINSLADKLIRQGRSDTQALQQRREELNHKWKALQGSIADYRIKLAGASEVHAFNRDVDDTNDRINEKAVTLSVDDDGKDLHVVEALQRKQEAVEREMTAIESKLREHDSEARRLIQKYPDMATPIRTKVTEIQENWRKLTNLCHGRKQRLASAYTLCKFLFDLKKLESWVNDMTDRMTSGELATSNVEAQSMLQLHQERKAEIDGRKETFQSLKEFGHRLLQQKHPAKETIEESLQYLEELRRTLTQAWEEQRQMLTQCYDLQVFKEHAKQAETWLASKEAFLNNEDLGDSMCSVEVLIRKHDNFEKTMVAQSDKVDKLEKYATELTANKHYSSVTIQARCQAICQRRDRLKENAMVRRKKLEESKNLQQFLQNIYEVVKWINEKIQLATDESYRDTTNLLSKIQKHAAFEAELTANKGRVDSVTQEGEHLIGAGHFASMEIQTQLAELEALWRQLLDETAIKKERLQDAYYALQFNRMLDDLDAWIDDCENQLQSEDHGKDLTSVQNLLKKHQLLEVDINNHIENIEQVKDQAANFCNNNHFMKDEINERSMAVINRYESLHEPTQIRRENLEDALMLQQFFRDVEDELSWISEKEPLASSAELGTSLSLVQNLQKKHQALEAEIHAHEPLVSAVTSKGRHMIRSSHFAAKDIESKLQELQSQLHHLKDLASIRRLRLQDAVESQMFYTEASEAEAWIREKRPLLTNPDLGKDEDSVQTLMKKLDGLVRDIESFNNNIAKLAKLGQGLVERGHFDNENILKKQVSVEEEYEQLQKLAEERDQKLQDSRRFFTFMREADEVEAWIHDQMVIASSEDVGKDLEHIEILIQKFEGFLISLHSSEERVGKVKKMADVLIEQNHPQTEEIGARSFQVAQLWKELQECSEARQEALVGAKEVHTFDRSADETISWISEKDTTLSTDEFGHDLESVLALLRRHEGFQRDLAAVKEQVQSLVKEAQRLASIYPDAREHISAKHEEVADAWNQLLEKSAQRKDRLQQAEKLQAYYDEYRMLMSWINEMMALITADELAKDVPGAEALLARHKEHKVEIDARMEPCFRFQEKGEAIITAGHFMADDVRDHIEQLKTNLNQLLDTWEKRQVLYEQNLDTQKFILNAEQLELWLQSREPVLRDNQFGDSIAGVEELIRKHDDFEKTIEAQEESFSTLKRVTLLEEAFHKQQQEEEVYKKEEAQRQEQERVDAMKRKEQKRILDERRKEDERRRTQEIVFKRQNEEYDTDNEAQDQLSPFGSSPRLPEIRVSGTLYRPASQRSLDGDKASPVKRVESMRVECLTPKRPDAFSPLKRSESVKLDERQKKAKRTPSFNTRRRTPSFRQQRRVDDLLPVEMEGFLERKQELQSGGKRATIRSWKTYYTVLCGQLLCFFKGKDAFIENNASSPPLVVAHAKCSKATDYTKKKHVFRLQLSDGSEYLFMAHMENEMHDWLEKLSFHASLPPSMQLMSYETYKSSNLSSAVDKKNLEDGSPLLSQKSDNSSYTQQYPSSPESTPEQHQRVIRNATSQPELQNKQQTVPPPYSDAVQKREKVKPPVPPRTTTSRPVSEPPQLYGPDEKISVKSRIQIFQEHAEYSNVSKIQDQSSPSFTTFAVSGHSHHQGQNGIVSSSGESNPALLGNRDTYSTNDTPVLSSTIPPPLPNNPPPRPTIKHTRAESDDDFRGGSDSDLDWQGYRRDDRFTSEVDGVSYWQALPVNRPQTAQVSRHMSLPPGTIPPEGYRPQQYDTRTRQMSSDGSSEGELATHAHKGKDRKGVFRGFFKRK